MSPSRIRRRVFAAPLVVTAATLPACLVSTSSTPPKGSTVETKDHRTADDADHHDETVPHTNPPRPTNTDDGRDTPPVTQDDAVADDTHQGDPPGVQRNWTVNLQDDGSCLATMVITCKKGQSCNPPRPTAVACPDGITADGPMSIYAASGSWDCYVQPKASSCPKNATCNPPPPKKTACPK